ncbi:PUR2 protein, partial [Polypterus senegalus]
MQHSMTCFSQLKRAPWRMFAEWQTNQKHYLEEVDAGAIIVQDAVPVLVGDTEDSLSERVKEAEHRAFPAALELVASGAVRLGENNKICWNI